MKILNKKQMQRETNIATSDRYYVDNGKPKKDFSKAKMYYLLWSIVSMAFNIGYAFYVIFTVAKQNFLASTIKILLVIYGVILVLVIMLSLGNKKKMKSRLKTYRSALNFLKYLIQLISFSLAIVNAISSFFVTGQFARAAIASAFTSLIITVIMIFIEIVKLMIRKNIPIVKQNLLKIKEKEEIEKQEKINKKLQRIEEKKNLKNVKRKKGLINYIQPLGEMSETTNNDNSNDNNNLQYANEDVYVNSDDNYVNVTQSEPVTAGFKQEKEEYAMKSGLFGNLFKHSQNNIADNLKKDYNSYGSSDNNSTVNDDFPVLGKNEEYDEYAGVVIDYDDEDEDEEDFYDEQVLRDNNIKKGGKFSKFFNKFNKK